MASPSASDRPDSESNSLSTSSGTMAGGEGVGHGPEGSGDGLTPARASEQLIQRFGGIRPMANKLEVPFTTVQGWKKRGAIPAARISELRAAAQRHGIALDEAELEVVARSDDRHSDAPRSMAQPRPSQEPASEPSAPIEPAPIAPKPGEPTPAEPMPVEPVPPFEIAIVPTSEIAVVRTSEPTPVPPPVPAPPPPEGAVPVVRPQPTPDDSTVAPPATLNSRLMALGAARVSLAGAGVALIAAAVAILGSSSSSGPSSAADPRLNTLESAISRVALQQDSQTAAIEKQISTLDARLALAASQQSTEGLAARVAILEQGLPTLQRQVSGQGLGSSALADLLAATQLRNQLETSSPFVTELAAFRLTAFNDPPLKQALDQIANRGKAGIPTEAWLIGRFSVVAANIVRVASWNHPGQRIADLLLDVLSDWAPPLYRLTGVPEGSTPRAITERAQAWMSAGDFSRAVEQLGELTDKPAETAVAWLAEARARVIADHARELLGKHMLALAEPDTARP